MDTHVQSAMHKQESGIVGLVIMMRVVIGEMVFVPGTRKCCASRSNPALDLPCRTCEMYL